MSQAIFVNRFYWPDEAATAQLLTDLAEALAARGRSVTVIASRPGREVPLFEERRGVRIQRVGATRGRGDRILSKALDFSTFHASAAARLLRVARRGDSVVALTDPPLIGAAAAFAARCRGARCLHWIQDIYPEVAVAVTGRRMLGIVRPVRNAAWKQASACVTLGRDMAALVAEAGVPLERIHVVSNWAPAELLPPPPDAVAARRADWGISDQFVVAYSGNFGRVHDFVPLLDAAAALRDERGIVFLFIGDGAQRGALQAAVSQRGLGNVRFLPSQARSGLAAALAAGDVQIVTLKAGCERTVFPSKIYGIAAVGRPVVFIGPRNCEPARLIADHAFGCCITQDEAQLLGRTLRDWSKDPALRAALGAAASRFAAATPGVIDAAEVWTRLLDSP